MSLRICILETDILRPELVDQYQGYGQMFKHLFSQQPIAAEFTVYNVMQGEYPSDELTFDAYLVTGSKADSFGTCCWAVKASVRPKAGASAPIATNSPPRRRG